MAKARSNPYAAMGPKAAKADKAMDKKLGIKIGGKEDTKIDKAVAGVVKGKPFSKGKTGLRGDYP